MSTDSDNYETDQYEPYRCWCGSLTCEDSCLPPWRKEEKQMDGQELKSGTKKDEGKARLDLVPYEVVTAVAEILTSGAKKYAPRNWEKGIAYGRVFAGVMRHLYEWWLSRMFGRDGINHADGKNSHLDHAITGLMFLSAYEKRGLNGTEFDDRPGPNSIRSKAVSEPDKV